eukprot:GHVH01004015.1.p1 GENE.GHVH01004015.1~~GHVH01004015.1.p1  ORF type:complete len:460 (+),score=88.40 GHVH01004015.1:1674-3053(+)
MGKQDKQKFDISDFSSTVKSHIPSTLEDAEAKGQHNNRRDGGRGGDRDGGGRDGGRDGGGRRMMMSERRDEKREEMSESDMTFTRGSKAVTERPPQRREVNDNDAFSRGNRSGHMDNGIDRRNRDEDRRDLNDSEMTFTRGSRTMEREPTRQMGSTSFNSNIGQPMATAGGDELMFRRGGPRKVADNSAPQPQADGLMTRIPRRDGKSALVQQKEKREAEEAARAEEMAKTQQASQRACQEEAEKKKQEQEKEAEKKKQEQEKEAEKKKREQAKSVEAPFTEPHFQQQVMDRLSNEISTCFSAMDFNPLAVFADTLDHNTYNAIGTFLISFIVHAFRFGFVQESKMSTETYMSLVCDGLAALGPLFSKTQSASEEVSVRIIWEIMRVNQIFNGACLNTEIHIADAMLQCFILSGNLRKDVANRWFNCELNSAPNAPKDAAALWRKSQKYARKFSKMLDA